MNQDVRGKTTPRIEDVPAPAEPSLADWQETRLAIIKLAIEQLPRENRLMFTAIFIEGTPKIEFCRLSGLSRWQLRRKIQQTCKTLENSPLLQAIAKQ